jgi:hypothetical protein
VIGVPFEDNDLTCLGAITELVAALVGQHDPRLVELAARYPTVQALAAWIRSLPQRNDEGLADDGPRVDACMPPQRLRILPEDPNCVERAALYLGAAELIDPYPVRRLATIDYSWGRHTFPVEEGAPVVLDPRASYDELAQAIASEEHPATRNRRRPLRLFSRSTLRAPAAPGLPTATAPMTPLDAAELPPPVDPPSGPIAIDVNDAIDFTSELAQQAAAGVRNGPSRAYLARNAIQDVVTRGVPPTDPRTVDAIGWFFSIAERVARDYGARALTIVRTTALAISDLIDDILAQRQSPPHPPRNLSFEVGGASYSVPTWVSGLGALVGRIGLDVGALALAPKLAAMGITGPMLDLVEQELNAEGLSLGPLANPKRSFASALTPLSRRRLEY